MLGGHGGNIYEMARRQFIRILLKTPSDNRMLAERLVSLVDESANRLRRDTEIHKTFGI